MSSRVRSWEPSPHATPIGRRAMLLSGLALPLGLMIQIWYPAHAVDGHSRAPYFTPVLARAYEKYLGIPVALNWPVTDARLGAPVHQREGGWPVVLYSPGLGDQRSDTTCLVEELASRGYVVVMIDHLRHHDSHLLAGPSPRFPEVRFVR